MMKQVAGCVSEGKCQTSDCLWTDWEEWGGCSKSCGGGEKARNRFVKEHARNGGKSCVAHNKTELGACNTQTCNPACVNGEWSPWGAWSQCSSTCDSGYEQRSRGHSVHPNFCGTPALGISGEYRLCTGLPPCMKEEDCQLSPWGQWSDCSASCFGIRDRQRIIKQYANLGGKLCNQSDLKEVEPCNPVVGADVPQVCGGKTIVQDCKLSDWTAWSECPVHCGGSQTSRTRLILQHSINMGKPCEGQLEQ